MASNKKECMVELVDEAMSAIHYLGIPVVVTTEGDKITMVFDFDGK